jgi:hypothetical protein
MLTFIQKYQSGGLIDTDAMKTSIKENSEFFKDGDYTAAGKKRLAAIKAIENNQSKGLRYEINDEEQTFKIVDRTGKELHDIEGRGMAMNEGRFNPLYGTIGKANIAKKEISSVISQASSFIIQPQTTLVPKETTMGTGIVTPTPVSEEIELPKETKEETSKNTEKTSSEFKPNIPSFGTPTTGASTQSLLERKKAQSSTGNGSEQVTTTQTTEATTTPKTNITAVSSLLPATWKDYGQT